MKITEVRNNLFGLSDLKGLITENVFDEAGLGRAGLDWGGYFNDNPERLKLSFLQAMGLPTAPKTPLTIEDFEAIGGGESEIRKYFGDEEFASILSNPINFIKDHGVKNTYDKRLKDYRKKLAYGNVEKTVQPVDILRELFIKNGCNEITKTTTLSPAYFETVMEVSQKAIYEAIANGFRGFSDTYIEPNGQQVTLDIGNIYDPFLFFLFLYYITYFSRGSGQADYIKNKREQYKTKVLATYPEYAEMISWVLNQMEGGSVKNQNGGDNIISSLNRIFLKPVGLSFMSEMTQEVPGMLYNAGKLYDTLMSNGLNVIDAADEKTIDKYEGKVGGFLLKVLYLFGINSKINAAEVKNAFENYIPWPEYGLLRGTIYRARYNTFFNKNKNMKDILLLINSILAGYHENNADAIFDPLVKTSIVKVREAGLYAQKQGVTFEQIEGLEMPEYTEEENLTPFEMVILFSRNVEGLLSDNAVKYYGGDNILNEGTLFLPAGQGLKILNGIEKKNRQLKERYQTLENIYVSEKEPEDWSFYDLLSKDFFGGDRTQRAIYYFLKVNTKPGTADWIYEYNRKTQSDQELNPKSIDILCKYDGKVAAFEYQGEQHFRPEGVTPADEIENAKDSPNVKLFNELKNNILSQYLKAHEEKKLGDPNFNNKWESAEIYEPIMREAYEKSFEQLIGMPFMEVYEREMRRAGYMKTMPSYKKMISESAFDRQRDITDIINYTFCLLCNWHKLPLPVNFENAAVIKDIFVRPKMGTDAVYLGSPWRFKRELHIYFGKISDKEKADLIKKRGWAAAYILPPASRISPEDITLTRQFANPSNAVFEWTNKDSDRQKILDFAKNIGIEIQEKEEDNALFEEIFKELSKEYNPQ